MIGLDDIVEGVLGGTSWGVGAIAIAAVAVVGAPRAKPLAKQAIKGYLAATERVREMAAEATEQIQDLYAEAKYEYESQLDGEEAQNGTAETASEAAPRPRRRGASSTGLVTPSGEPV
ncbi:MAG TPA: DUF5132 domain-containing protein [Chloroflexota bacterium]|jgi:gas vesicle protein